MASTSCPVVASRPSLRNRSCVGLPMHAMMPQHQQLLGAAREVHSAGTCAPPPSPPSDTRPALQLLHTIARGLSTVALAATLLFGAPVGDVQAKHRLTADEQKTVDLFQKSTPSVVYITNLAVRRDAFTLDMLEIPQGAGSGFVWDKQGHLVTNYHVVRDASDLQVTLQGGKEYNAKVIGFDADKDIAVLKINSEAEVDLKPLPIGTSSDLLVGQRVYAIGNPFGLDHTLTTGVVSGTGREITSGINGRPIQDVIQTDAAINPGSSGGPLLDSIGEVIGVNTAIYSPSGASSGVGFAIPSDVVRSSVEQIIKYGKVVRPVIGISFAPDQSVEQLGVRGVLVLDAREGGPASKAGIKGTSRDSYGRLVLGDIIVAFNGTPVKSASDLYKVLDKCKVGEQVAIEVLRDSTKENVTVTLEANT